MDQITERRIPRADFIGLAAGVIGAIISIVGAIWVYVTQAAGGTSPMWPLPGLALLDWAVLGIFVFIATYMVFRWSSIGWQQSTWFLAGALIPLTVLGAFSIGPFVLITLLLLVISIVLLALCRKPRWLPSILAFFIGGIINLAFLYIVIALVNRGV